ncbi:MAG: hypothetical protein HYT47_00415 [Candidatus Vogelbacteria bacterium]|nr:hypothetical protein [Candidatus Vogelbacteria bacterium]
MSDSESLKDNLSEKSLSDKDIKDKRVEKLTSALYLVTNFLSDKDPIKWKIRQSALDILFFATRDHPRVLSHITDLLRLIDVVVVDRQSSVMNFNLLRQEYLRLYELVQNQVKASISKIASIIASEPVDKSLPVPEKALKSTRFKTISKNERQSVILQVLNVGAWSAIKDVAKKLPNLSGKTVQRELNALAQAGLVRRIGARRWSRYSKI